MLSGFGRPLGAEQVLKAAGHWPTELEQLRVGRPDVCRNVLWIHGFRESVMCLGTYCSCLSGRPEHLDRAPAHLMAMEGAINNGANQLL